jgi:hypothetical protein
MNFYYFPLDFFLNKFPEKEIKLIKKKIKLMIKIKKKMKELSMLIKKK